MENNAPFHIIGHPLSLWVAPVGTAFPAISAAPNGSWFQLGTEGDLDYHDDGVTVSHEQTLSEFRGASGVMPRKVWRTEAELLIKVNVCDLTPEQYAKILDDLPVSTNAQAPSVAGNKVFDIDPGITVAQHALLARGPSPVAGGLNAQYEVGACVRDGNMEVVYKKGEPAGLEAEFRCMKLSSAPAARLRVQTTVPGS